MGGFDKALRCLNKLNNYAKLPADHRWVSVIRHYIKDKGQDIKDKGQEERIPMRCKSCLHFIDGKCRHQLTGCFKARSKDERI